MFREKFVSRVTKISLKRDDDSGNIVSEIVLKGSITDSQLVDLGSDVLAMVEARNAGDHHVLPFKNAELDQDYSDQVLTAFAGAVSDPEARVRFEVKGVTVNKLKLLKSEEQPTRPDLVFNMKLPAIRSDDLIWIIGQLGHEFALKIGPAQRELPLGDEGDEGDGEG